jgi:hypothetical protein
MRTKRKNAVAMLLSAGALLAVAPVATLAQDVAVGHPMSEGRMARASPTPSRISIATVVSAGGRSRPKP